MTKQIEHLSICDDPFDCSDAIIYYDLIFDEYGIIVHKPDARYFLSIHFCPWCGAKLPESKRDLWFDKLEAMGFTDITFADISERTDIPKEFLTDEWYRKPETDADGAGPEEQGK
ncbi:MAG: hypothetical protein M1376_20420 [Planctomycetes bacterium]|nr:hypothetical protein [Planctomycetota bacterium]